MGSSSSRGEGNSTGELVSASLSISSSSSSSSSSSLSSSSRSSLRLPSLPLLPPPPTLPSPRGIASAVADSGDAARRHVQLALRTADFWRRATGIYLAYKGKQAQEAALKSRALSALVPGSKPWDKERLEEELWKPHHEWAGKEMYELAVSVRGFYLKVGQFFAARSEFVPVQICKRLSLLHDSVPPMPAAMAQKVIEAEFRGAPLGDIFEWIDLEKPLGAASVAQVHKARLRGAPPGTKKKNQGGKRAALLRWLARSRLNPFRGRVLARDRRVAPPRPDVPLLVPSWEKKEIELDEEEKKGKNARVGLLLKPSADSEEEKEKKKQAAAAAAAAVAAARAAFAAGDLASDCSSSSFDQALVAPEGLVAVKVQYPGAAALMAHDIQHVRVWAKFLSKTEIAFDLVSAVDELDAQVALEFDFEREARVMDAIAGHIDAALNDGGQNNDKKKGRRRRKSSTSSANVVVPRSVPGLVTRRVLTMGFVDGIPLTKLKGHVSRLKLPKRLKVAASRRILSSVASAYGAMILGEGLFQADSHPGNVMVLGKGGLARGSARVALLDYGQSKQLPETERVAFAELLLAMAPGFRQADERAVADRLLELGLRFSKDEPATLKKMAYAMFDTRCSYRVDPFAPDSPIKSVAIKTFPPDVFFVLRVIQMLRGLAGAMDVTDFSIVEQWLPRAKVAVAEGPRMEEVGGTARPCVTWPSERWEAAVLEMQKQKQQLISEGGQKEAEPAAAAAGGGAAREGQVAATVDAAAVSAAVAAPAQLLPPLLPTTTSPPPPPPPPLRPSPSTTATTTTSIRPAEVTPQVPSTVAYSAGVVGAAPEHLEELVAKREERETARRRTPTAARTPQPTTTTQPQTPESASLSSSPALARANTESSSSSSKSTTSISAQGMRLSFRAVPALHLVPVRREEERGKEEEKEEVKATTASAATRAAAATR